MKWEILSLRHPPAGTTRREFSTTTYICLTVPYTGCLGLQFRDLQETVLKCNLAETLEERLVWTRNVRIEVNTIAILSPLGPHGVPGAVSGMSHELL